MRTANPTMNDKAFASLQHVSSTNQMTVEGTINKTLLSLLLLIVSAGYVWSMFLDGGYSSWFTAILIGGSILGLIVAVITVFKKSWAPVTTPLYALLEGGVIGLLSALLETMFPGIVIQAAALTFGTLLLMLGLYKYRIIPVTDKLRMGIVMATGAIFFIYLITWILSFFSVAVPFIHEGGTFGIIFSLVVVGVAAFNLLLDFDFIEKGSTRNLPKYMEWYGAFGLIVTLVWLYIEILRLLSKIRSSD